LRIKYQFFIRFLLIKIQRIEYLVIINIDQNNSMKVKWVDMFKNLFLNRFRLFSIHKQLNAERYKSSLTRFNEFRQNFAKNTLHFKILSST
jgi:hypothetical protein